MLLYKKKESRVKFNPGLALIGLRTTGPWPITFQGEKVVDNKGLITEAQINHLPFDSNTCEVNLMANGKSLGTTGSKAFSAKLPR